MWLTVVSHAFIIIIIIIIVIIIVVIIIVIITINIYLVAHDAFPEQKCRRKPKASPARRDALGGPGEGARPRASLGSQQRSVVKEGSLRGEIARIQETGVKRTPRHPPVLDSP